MYLSRICQRNVISYRLDRADQPVDESLYASVQGLRLGMIPHRFEQQERQRFPLPFLYFAMLPSRLVVRTYCTVTGITIVCVSVPAVAVMFRFELPVITCVMAIELLVPLCLSPL